MTNGWSLPVGSLDRWPEDYERGRPGWPPEVVEIPGLPSAATVLELGAGTGKLTRLLVSAFGAVFAVELAEAMRRLLVTRCPEAEVLDTRLANPQTVDWDGLVAFFASMGWIADLPDADRLPLVDEVRSRLAAAEYQRPWETHAHWTRLAAALQDPSADAERSVHRTYAAVLKRWRRDQDRLSLQSPAQSPQPWLLRAGSKRPGPPNWLLARRGCHRLDSRYSRRVGPGVTPGDAAAPGRSVSITVAPAPHPLSAYSLGVRSGFVMGRLAYFRLTRRSPPQPKCWLCSRALAPRLSTSSWIASPAPSRRARGAGISKSF